MTKITTSNAEYVTKVSVEFFPSRVELYSYLDSFLEKNGHKKDYTSDNKDSLIEFSFKNPDTAFEFVKNLNLEKLKNSLYSRVKTNMYVDVKQHTNTNNNKKTSTGKSHSKSNLSTSIIPNTNRSLDLNTLNKSSISNTHLRSESTGLNSLKRSMKSDSGESGGTRNILLISTPYISEDEKMKREFKENKKKWVIKNDFSKYVGKATINKSPYIPNYVNLTPSDPPVNYQFRNIHKDKWIAKKNFFV